MFLLKIAFKKFAFCFSKKRKILGYQIVSSLLDLKAEESHC